MPTSMNGWSAARDLAIRPLVVAGESFIPGIRDDDDVFTVLQYVAEQLCARVEPIFRDDWHQADDWGFSYRPNVNSPNSLSNHSSGTAFDFNATRHPNGVPATSNFTPAQITEIHQILAECDGVVRWGGDYNGTPDAMHFEINAGPVEVAAVAAKLREVDMPTAEDIAKAVLDAYRNEDITVKTADGGRRTLKRSQWEVEVFQKAAKAAKDDARETAEAVAKILGKA